MADNRELYGILAQCGWKDFKGLISTYVKKRIPMPAYHCGPYSIR